MNRPRLIKINILTFSALGLLLLIKQSSDYPPLSLVQTMLGLFVIFYLSGANIFFVLRKIMRQRFDPLAQITWSILTSLVFTPLLLLTAFLGLGYTNASTVFLVYLIPAVFPLAWPLLPAYFPRYFKNTKKYEAGSPYSPRINKTAGSQAHWIWAIILLLIIFAVYTFNLAQYPFLPAPDAYSWLIQFEQNLPLNLIPLPEDLHRWSFSSLLAAIHFLTNIQPYNIFKYLLPYISLLTIPPLWLAARHLPRRLPQIIFSSLVLITPTIIYEFAIVRQQIIFLLFLFYAAGLLIDAYQRRSPTAFYLIGAYALFASLYHPAFSIIIITWLITFALTRIGWIWQHKLAFIFAFIISLPVSRTLRLGNMFIRIREQADASIQHLFSGDWNLKFPAHYVNSDGYKMGWAGLSGILKYYSFYAGPVIFLSALLFLLMLIFMPRFRTAIKRSISNQNLLYLYLTALFFFLIAEVAPRFADIAYLPDRAWQFLAILLLPPIFFTLKYLARIQPIFSRPAYIALIAAIIISTLGASYVNYMLKYTMPDYELAAADWMRTHLEPNAVVFSGTSKNIIRYHAGANFKKLDNSYYSNPSAQEILAHINSKLDFPIPITDQLIKISFLLSEIKNIASGTQSNIKPHIKERALTRDYYQAIETSTQAMQTYLNEVEEHLLTAEKLHDQNIAFITNPPPMYIYYARTHPLNPFSGRPYDSSFTTALNVKSFPALAGHPDIFEPVYQDKNLVSIWRINTNNFKSL